MKVNQTVKILTGSYKGEKAIVLSITEDYITVRIISDGVVQAYKPNEVK